MRVHVHVDVLDVYCEYGTSMIRLYDTYDTFDTIRRTVAKYDKDGLRSLRVDLVASSASLVTCAGCFLRRGEYRPKEKGTSFAVWLMV